MPVLGDFAMCLFQIGDFASLYQSPEYVFSDIALPIACVCFFSNVALTSGNFNFVMTRRPRHRRKYIRRARQTCVFPNPLRKTKLGELAKKHIPADKRPSPQHKLKNNNIRRDAARARVSHHSAMTYTQSLRLVLQLAP
jgi:hypothetical protein